ncbi:Pycsar system effector family protein [Gracilimonas sediminicola]|uniref:DUF5706 domain-containing protein n=1 Tax=Gracilimonas sediminicola TaxID=2952158 RepID=A0A9X2RHV2_9BACT|nr:Pycsar system effector family protein [Gracilimonas sediminicola]MCP9292633.1 DUF5706 domain-containing protein [Gracilimonas sediminicola]
MENTKSIDRLNYSWNIFLHQQELIKLADNKIRYLFLVSSVAATFILTESKTLETINISEILFMGSFVLFLAFASLTIKPRKTTHGGNDTSRLVYHQDIISRPNRAAYAADFREASDEELQSDLLHQIYEISSIANKKYRYYNYSFYTLCVQIIFFFIVLI